MTFTNLNNLQTYLCFALQLEYQVDFERCSTTENLRMK